MSGQPELLWNIVRSIADLLQISCNTRGIISQYSKPWCPCHDPWQVPSEPCQDLIMILTSVPCIMICHDLDKGTMVSHDSAKIIMITASVPWLQTPGCFIIEEKLWFSKRLSHFPICVIHAWTWNWSEIITHCSSRNILNETSKIRM